MDQQILSAWESALTVTPAQGASWAQDIGTDAPGSNNQAALFVVQNLAGLSKIKDSVTKAKANLQSFHASINS